MENNNLFKMDKRNNTHTKKYSNKNEFICCISLFVFFMHSIKSNAQFSNEGDVKVTGNTILSVYMDYNNKDTGNFINDGLVHIFQNWNNDGIVDFTKLSVVTSKGKTFFTGTEEQIIENSIPSNFQNVLFDNNKKRMPFTLAGTITVSDKAEFIKGIIDADTFDGLVVFNKEATHVNASDLSFVDGKVQKNGKAEFEYPVGDELFFRPSYHAIGEDDNIYTTHYFKKNSDDADHSHSSKEEGILDINDAEYWTVTKGQGADKIILSLSLDERTTPAKFLNLEKGKTLIIVRWDGTKWVNEGGTLSVRADNASLGAEYDQLITSEVKGYEEKYGVFTIALVDKKDEEPVNDLIVYNAISPNDDGKNDNFHIKGIDKYPDNTIEIYNRWGVKVYDAKGYNESNVMFAGYSDGRITIRRSEKLPTGTYFYILNYNNNKGKIVKKAGYLYISND